MDISNDELFLEKYRKTAKYMMNGVLEMVKYPDGSFNILFVNEVAAKLLCKNSSMAAAELDRDPYSFVYPADRERVAQAVISCTKNTNASETYRIIDKDGNIRWELAHFHSVVVNDEHHIVIIYTDVSELMGAQVQLQSEGDKLLDIVNSIPVGIAIMEIDNDGKTVSVSINDPMVTFSDNIGQYLDGNSRHWSKEELSMLFKQSVYAFCQNEDVDIVKGMLEDSKTTDIASCVFKLRGSTEAKPVFVKSTCCSKVASETSRNYYITFENVTKDKLQEMEIEKTQQELLNMSYYDTLTQVKNRNSFDVLMRNVRKFPKHNTGLMFADLNGLKKVNDILGHEYGDDMIVRFSRMLLRYFPEDCVYRISGDEFIAIYPEIDKLNFKRSMAELLREIEANDNIASIGYVWEEKLQSVKHAANRAEKIMYVEKARYHEMERSLQSKHRPLLLSSLISDFENRRFKMFLQPKADVNSSKVYGAEALVRKVDNTGKIIPPFEFIPQLEKERLIPKIDFYMLEEACAFLENLKKEGVTDFVISVNMSRVTMVESNYIQSVEKIFEKYDFNKNQLEFEITESNETLDNERMEEYIDKIKKLGVSISLDDVGTDYSSLPMLLLDGIDTVKLDRSLITKIKTPKANKLLKHITSMCHDLGMHVIAEGIETDEDRDDLKDINCDSFQGYLLSKPIPAEDFKLKYLDKSE